jgi:hypothetical protein
VAIADDRIGMVVLELSQEVETGRNIAQVTGLANGGSPTAKGVQHRLRGNLADEVPLIEPT